MSKEQLGLVIPYSELRSSPRLSTHHSLLITFFHCPAARAKACEFNSNAASSAPSRVMPLFELKWIEVQGLAESTLGDTIREAAKEYGVQVQADKEPDQNRFIRSDQYSFIREGVPSLAFKFGYEFGTPQDKIFHDWMRDRYHKPSDDLNQPVDKASAAKFNRIIASLLQKIADGATHPQWKDDSFFKRFAK